MNYINYIFQDWQINQDTSLKCRLILLMFRTAQMLERLPTPFSLFSTFYRVVYQILVDWILGVELPVDTQVGANLKLHHARTLVINHETVIGNNCILRHSTTIGNKKRLDGSISGSPKIGNNVDIGANVVIIGAVTIGDHAIIGAGSVVIKDVPEYSVVAGNPARVIRLLNAPDVSEKINDSKMASV
ncbi:serine acetyltransferase [Mastigocladopsis repens]|uniref:serine acetyltransferase n=1 Tax=Mastigocladopsis repens TaxID=221287 RepID=UPI0003808F96|nr:serine acetyltransferase [Mastigocladopsis repens]